MLTIFTLPKPFSGPAAVAQDNSIASWTRLVPRCQVILFGDEEGIAEAAARHGIEHEPQIARNQFGTPLLDDAFAKAQARARHEIVCYANSDIVFLENLIQAVRRVTLRPFLLVGRRMNLDVPSAIDFGAPDWARLLEERARREGELYSVLGIDYFVFPRGQITSMPPFPVGRALWDNWMIHHARSQKTPVIDATAALLAIHQNHDYRHIQGGQKRAWYGEEAQRNWQMVGPDFLPLSIADATHTLTGDGLAPARDARHLLRRAVVWPALTPGLRVSVRIARALWRRVAQ